MLTTYTDTCVHNVVDHVQLYHTVCRVVVVCVHACICLYVRTCMHSVSMCVHVCGCAFSKAFMCACVYVHTSVCMYICIHVCTYVRTYVPRCVCVCSKMCTSLYCMFVCTGVVSFVQKLVLLQTLLAGLEYIVFNLGLVRSI